MADDRALFVARNTDDRGGGTSRAQEQQSRKSAHAWHGQVEQDEVGVWRSVQRRDHAVEVVRDRDLRIGRRREYSLTQTADHKRMVIGDEHAKRALFAYGLLPRDRRRR